MNFICFSIFLDPLCCSSEQRRLGDAAVWLQCRHPRVFSKGPLPYQHVIDATHFEASSCRGAVAMMHSLDAVEGKAVGWAVLLVSTSVEVCVARERARGLETRRSLELACRALYSAARRCRCVPRSLLLHFGCHGFFAICSA